MLAAIVVLQAAITFTTIASGGTSAIDDARHVVVRDATEWQTLWKAHKPDSAPPAVDFTTSVVVAVFLGTRPTAGFEVAITAVRQDKDRTIVEYVERAPRTGGMVAQVLTSPFHIVRLPRDVGEVEFKKVTR